MKMKKHRLSLFLVILLIGGICLSSCSNKRFATAEPLEKNPEVTIELENGEKVVVELYYAQAPNTVRNFISLISDGFYDGLTFHRANKGFVIQGGDPNGNGTGGPGYSIVGEFADNGYKNNTLKHEIGVISMARSNDYDSAGSQFFICDGTATGLDGKYAAFGKVISGIDEVKRIASMETDQFETLLTPQIMKTVTVDTFGTTFSKPETK